MPRGVRDTARSMFSRGVDFAECRPGEEGEMTVSPGEQEDIRRMDRDGVPRSRIARELGVSRNTVAKYADMRDMSPEPPLVRRRARPATDGLSRWIDAILEADLSVLCFVNLSFHKTASVRFTRQREDSSRTSVALAPILSSPTTPRA